MARGKWVLITGASAGIGAAFAVEFARHGWNLIVTARRADRLAELSNYLNKKYGVNCVALPADLADPASPKMLYDEIAGRELEVDGLVNNAGYALPGDYVHTSWADQARLLQVMLTSVAELCHLFLPGMVDRGFGRIINVSSVLGLVPSSPRQTLYGPVKSFLVQLSQTLAIEAKDTGVHVCALCPGVTLTEFHDVLGVRDLINRQPPFLKLSADKVAEQGYRAVERGDVVYVNGVAYRFLCLLANMLPRPLVLSIMKRRYDNRYRDSLEERSVD